MKIAFFSDNFYPELSGISDAIILLATELAHRGHEIEFFVPKYSSKNFTLSNVPNKEPDLGPHIKINRLFSFPYPGPTKQARMVLPLLLGRKRFQEFNPDIVHTQLFFGVGLEALMLGKIFHKPVIGTNHTPITEFLKYAPMPVRSFAKASLKYVNWYYGKCEYVTAPSQSILQEMKSFGFEKNCEALSNPISLNGLTVSSTSKKEMKSKFHLSAHTLLYTGRIAPEKNIDVLLKMVHEVKKNIPDVSLAITGHGNIRPSLEALAKKLGIEKNVQFFGTVEKRVLQELYQAADVFVVASTAETQCLSLMNAFAFGVPAVGVRARALAEYITPEVGFVVEPGDSVAMAEKVFLLLHDEPLRNKQGEAGKHFVERFSPGSIASRWEEIYTTVRNNFHV